jgi:hypothetical protein
MIPASESRAQEGNARRMEGWGTVDSAGWTETVQYLDGNYLPLTGSLFKNSLFLFK